MNNEEKILNLLEKMYVDLQTQMQKGFKDVNERMDKFDTRLDNVETGLQEVKNTVVRIENDHGQKLNALFDGYKQNSDKLDRIEDELSKHEEIIIKRIK